MEDRHVAAVALGGDRAQALFAVFDGHGGKRAAEFAADNMPRIVAEELERSARGGGGAGRAAVEGAVRRAYLRTDDEFSSSSNSKNREQAGGGACCVTALLRGTWRVQGSLAVTRGIGDAHLKPWVVAEPETTTVLSDKTVRSGNS
uniref:protein-serine/threonine phosphatase n=1 Tax=Hordeum vulgare subsp. vulgare TaxID=112509 RepID=F2DT03_HORVV|nr:predicted protein [Hordeum vulgare subsp. vulgare]